MVRPSVSCESFVSIFLVSKECGRWLNLAWFASIFSFLSCFVLRFLLDCELTGSIPSTIGKLTGLVKIHLSGNNLNSAIPSELGRLTDLSLLALANNNLTGTLPSQLSNLSTIRTLAFQGNALGGTLPSEFSELIRLGKF